MKKFKIKQLLFIICFVVFSISSYMIISHWARLSSEKQAFNKLSEQVRGSTSQDDKSLLKDISPLKTLAQQNSDLHGWITIANTPINYPVMYTPENAEFYLSHGFDKKPSISGTPFISEGSEDSSLNTIIYGHKMDDDTMFSTLLSYAEAAYYNKHPIVTYNTLLKNAEYEIFAAFYSEDYSLSDEKGFMYYNYYNIQDKATYDDFVANCKAISLYDTGIMPEYGDELITLSTCSYHKKDGRFVVVAKIK